MTILPGWLLTGPKSFMNWRYKTGRSGNQVRREAVRIAGHQVLRYVGLGVCTPCCSSLGQESTAWKTQKNKFILSISDHSLSWLNGVWFQETSLLHCVSSLTEPESELVWEIHEDHGKRWSGEASLQNWVALKQAKGIKCYNAGPVSPVLFSCC